MTILQLNNLLDKNIEVYWNNDSYIVKREENGNLIIVCSDNGFTSSLDEDDLEDCGINKWDARELGFANGHSYTVKVIY
tara:strand:- start:951 stop:1187 length:237 start_codon:yes stop_codon:yes gene_type:complete